MKELTEREILSGLKYNPLYDTFIGCKIVEHKVINSLEREYVLDRPSNCLNYFKQRPGDKQLFQRVNNVEILNMYKDYTYVFGPYIDSNATEARHVLFLYHQVDRLLYLKILYLDSFLNNEVVNQDCVRVNYTPYKFTEQERISISKMYPGSSKWITVYLLHGIRPWVELKDPDKPKKTASLITLLYEIYVIKRRLTEYERVKPINGRFTDFSLDNLTLVDSVKEALDNYKLDISKLLELYTPVGFDRFRGIYHLTDMYGKPGRRLIVLYSSVTGKDHKLLLARARKIVELGRLLDPVSETVDHIDRNYLNDSLSNLQVLPIKEHTNLDRVRIEFEEVACSICNSNYALPYSHTKLIKKGINMRRRCIECRKNKAVKDKGMSFTKEDLKHRYYMVDKLDKGKRVYLKSKTYMGAFLEGYDSVKIVPITD